MTDKTENKAPGMVREEAVKYDAKRIYTYDDVQSWMQTNEDERWELIDGIPYAMSRPRPRHQEINAELTSLFTSYLKGKSCRAFPEMEVRLNTNRYDTYLVPDLLVLCDKNKLGPRGVEGAPDLVIEILSSNSRHDRLIKRNEYAKAGIKEYWLVDGENQLVEVLLLGEDGIYRGITYGGEKPLIQSALFDDLKINVNDLFADSWIDTMEGV